MLLLTITLLQVSGSGCAGSRKWLVEDKHYLHQGVNSPDDHADKTEDLNTQYTRIIIIIIIIKAVSSAQDPLKKAANALSGSEKM